MSTCTCQLVNKLVVDYLFGIILVIFVALIYRELDIAT